uniref:Uncharacterized protein n=1 Tax=Anguilla anguilla TaxID=7936 RepID=A0A0E9XDZ6_ANGAN
MRYPFNLICFSKFTTFLHGLIALGPLQLSGKRHGPLHICLTAFFAVFHGYLAFCI